MSVKCMPCQFQMQAQKGWVGGGAVDILAGIHLPETVARLLEVILHLLWNVLQQHRAFEDGDSCNHLGTRRGSLQVW